jgi:AcrR family transcriptional regulator
MAMAKGRPRAFDTDTALEIALKQFWQYGYEGTSIAQLAEAMNINAPSLYAAFGNKEELFLKVIQRYSEQNGCLYHDALVKPTALEVAKAILEGEVELITRTDCPSGCLMIQGALTTSPSAEKIRQLMSDMRAMAESWMRERFERAQAEGDLPPDADPAALACYIMTLNCGLAAQAKSGVGKDILLRVVEVALRNWPHVDLSLTPRN